MSICPPEEYLCHRCGAGFAVADIESILRERNSSYVGLAHYCHDCRRLFHSAKPAPKRAPSGPSAKEEAGQ